MSRLIKTQNREVSFSLPTTCTDILILYKLLSLASEENKTAIPQLMSHIKTYDQERYELRFEQDSIKIKA
jgi:hypothetical protein